MYIDYYIFKHAEHENKSFKSITQKTKKLWTLFYFFSNFLKTYWIYRISRPMCITILHQNTGFFTSLMKKLN